MIHTDIKWESDIFIAASHSVIMAHAASIEDTPDTPDTTEHHPVNRSTIDTLILKGIRTVVQYPHAAGIIFMIMVYVLFFRTVWLLPFICVLSVFWYLEARSKKGVLTR